MEARSCNQGRNLQPPRLRERIFARRSRFKAEPERGYGWLAAVIPANAIRFRVADPALATVLSDAEADVTEVAADVEIAPLAELSGEAPTSIVVLGPPGSRDRPFAVRAALRLFNVVQVWLTARYARRTLRRRGYPSVRVLRWDYHQPLRDGASRRRLGGRRSLVEHLPQRALVVGSRTKGSRPLLDAVLAEAGAIAGVEVRAHSTSVRTGVLIANTDRGMLRVAVGSGSRQIRNQREALAALHGLAPPLVADRVPQELAGGRFGLAEWSLERKLAGSTAGHPVNGQLLSECVEFLVALHLASRDDPRPGTLLEQAESVAGTAPPGEAKAVRALAGRLETELADVPRVFAHGDFFHGNLLVDDGRLLGVVDWDAAGHDRLPLIDLLHLRHVTLALPDVDWGPRLVHQLLPWVQRGGDDFVRSYCARLAVPLERLEALALAYWLDRVSSQLRSHSHRLAQPLWLERNITLVLRAVGSSTRS